MARSARLRPALRNDGTCPPDPKKKHHETGEKTVETKIFPKRTFLFVLQLLWHRESFRFLEKKHDFI